MTILNLEKAIQLYELLNNYLPRVEKDFDLLEFVDQTIKNIREANQHRVYLDAISLLTGYDVESMVANSNPEDVLQYFINGLIENKIVDLVKSMEKLGYGRAG